MTSIGDGPTVILPLTARHRDEAAELAAAQYREATQRNSLLSEHFTSGNKMLPIMRNTGENRTGVAAVRAGKLEGFMTGFMFEFHDIKTTLIPDWGLAVPKNNTGECIRELYAALAGQWVCDGYCKHVVVTPAGNKEILDAWFSLGFGMDSIDAIRDVNPLQGQETDIDIRAAGPDDLELLMTFNAPLRRHLNQTPVFLYVPPEMEDVYRRQYEEQLSDPKCMFFLAYRNGEPAGCMRVIPAAQGDFRLAFTHEKICWITMAFTVAEERKTGIATALLTRVLEWARSKGYNRCAVDFESGNIPGARFWLKHFQPANYTLVRRIDERITKQNNGDPKS